MKWKLKITLATCTCFTISTFLLLHRIQSVTRSLYNLNDPRTPHNITTPEPVIDHFAYFDESKDLEDFDMDKKWSRDRHHPWDVWKGMIKERSLTHASEDLVHILLNEMRTASITAADIVRKESQVHIRLSLSGGFGAVFKPKSGKLTDFNDIDRHKGEIAAFHLDRVLEFYRAPPVVGRVIDVKRELLPVATTELQKHFFHQGRHICFKHNDGQNCTDDLVCGTGSTMEGALILSIPKEWRISSKPHPWRRSYNVKTPPWRTDGSFCESVKEYPPYNSGPRLLDLIDTAVFDYLTGNTDRHHYEYFSKYGNEGMILHLNNGVSFVSAKRDDRGILAPLYQCCRLRRKTFNILSSFIKQSENSSLSSRLTQRLRRDPLYPILTKDYLNAIDRRLRNIFVELDACFLRTGKENVLMM